MNYQLTYDALIHRAKLRAITGYTERHHIVPKCLGGDDHSGNLVNLTAKEHFVAHHLLFRIHPHNSKLAYSFKRFVQGDGNEKQPRYAGKISAKEYARIKNLALEAIRAGARNSGLRAVSSGHLQRISALPKVVDKEANKLQLDSVRHKAVKASLAVGSASLGGKSSAQKGIPSVAGKAGGKITSEQGISQDNFRKAAAANRAKSDLRFSLELAAAGFNEDNLPSLEQAKNNKLRFYYGSVCKKHPELKGKRVTNSRSCHQCILDNKQKRRKNA